MQMSTSRQAKRGLIIIIDPTCLLKPWWISEASDHYSGHQSTKAPAKQSEAAYLEGSEDVSDCRCIKMINYRTAGNHLFLFLTFLFYLFFTTPLAEETNHQVPAPFNPAQTSEKLHTKLWAKLSQGNEVNVWVVSGSSAVCHFILTEDSEAWLQLEPDSLKLLCLSYPWQGKLRICSAWLDPCRGRNLFQYSIPCVQRLQQWLCKHQS